MNNQHIAYEQAAMLKDCGFDWETEYYYEFEEPTDTEVVFKRTSSCNSFNHNTFAESFSAPILAQAAKWLRDKHNLHIQIESVMGMRWTYTLIDIHPQFDIDDVYCSRIPERDGYPVFDTYESALFAGIDAALELIITEKL